MINSYEPTLIYLQEEDAIKAGATDMKMTLEACETVYRLMAANQIYNPPKTHIGLPLDSDKYTWDSYFNAMSCYLGGDVNIGGVKWAAESKANVAVPGIPYGIDITILSDPKTVLPFCVLNGSLITAMRTGATVGLMAKYTAPSNTDTATSIGCGVVGRCTLMAICEAVPQVKTIYVADLDIKKAQEMIDEYQPKYPDVRMIATDDAKAAAMKSQLILCQTTANKEFVDISWMKPGTTLIALGNMEVEVEVAEKSDVLVCDYFTQLVTSDVRPVTVLYNQGKIQKSDTVDLSDVILDPKKGRANDEQFVYASALGLGALDIMISYRIFQRAKEQGIGKILKMYDNPLWE